MKQRSTTPVSRGLAAKSIIVACAVMMAVATPFAYVGTVKADKYDDQIQAIQKQIDEYQSQASKLSNKAKTLQNQLARIGNEKAQIQSQIVLAEAQSDSLEKKISETKIKISDNKSALGSIIADMYVDGSISPLEMLASSNNIGDYVDQQSYQASVSDQLKAKITKINDLKSKLEKDQKAIKVALVNKNKAKSALVAKEQERATILSKTKGQEKQYRKLSSEQEAAKLQVQQQQQSAIEAAMQRASRSAGGGGNVSGGGSLGSYASWVGDCYVDGNAISYSLDPLGYGCNQCVSYTAWKTMQATGGNIAPSYWGNANMWPGSARAAGLKVDGNPSSRSLGVISAGQYGHIVYIENYNRANNTVDISQYNYLINGQWGKYSTASGVPAGTYDTYIHLP